MRSEPLSNVPPRNQGIDTLRGIAILLVLINHMAHPSIINPPELHGITEVIYWKLKSFGWSGVDLFFVLSGYLISGLLFKELERRKSLDILRFWGRRAFKIIPSYALLLVVLARTNTTSWMDTTSINSIVKSLIQHGLFLQNYLHDNPNGPTWSLAVEEHFYLILPVILCLLSKNRTREQFSRILLRGGFLLILFILSIRIYHTLIAGVHPNDHKLSHFRIDSLFVGVLVQLLSRTQHWTIQVIHANPKKALLTAAFLIAPSFFFSRGDAFMFSIGFSMLAAGYALLVILFARDFKNQYFPRLRILLARIGTWSYNIFLWNFFISKLPIPYYLSLDTWLANIIISPVFEILIRASLFVIASIIIGAIMTVFFETPFLKLRERVLPAKV